MKKQEQINQIKQRLDRLESELFGHGIIANIPEKPKQYMVSVHEAITTQPDPYQVDWELAPDYADSHSYQSDGYGWWHGSYLLGDSWVDLSEQSGFTLPSGLDWKQSKRVRPNY